VDVPGTPSGLNRFKTDDQLERMITNVECFIEKGLELEQYETSK